MLHRQISDDWDFAGHIRDVDNGYRSRRLPKDDLDIKLARTISLMLTSSLHRPRGTIMFDHQRKQLSSDMPLASYWASVIEGGDGAWQEEAGRIRQAHCQLMRGLDQLTGMSGFSDVGAIKSLLVFWRAWGQLLIDSGYQPDLDKLFQPPPRTPHPT